MSDTFVSLGLSGGLILSLLGLISSAAGRPRTARAILGVGLIMWAAGLWTALPIVRMVALGMFMMFAVLALPAVLAVRGAMSQTKQNRLAGVILLFFPIFIAPWAAFAGPVFHHLFVARQSPAVALASQWLSTASVALLAVALAVLALPARRAEPRGLRT